MTDFDTTVRIADIRALLFRARVETPMVTSFGVLHERPALFVEIADETGATGWGEVWCNFPPLVSERRLEFITTVVAPMLASRTFDEPAEAASELDKAFGIQAIQAGEEGTLASVSAAIDQAMWDLIARRQGEPLWRVFGGRRSLRAYASGINPNHVVEEIRTHMSTGHRTFKIRAGFDDTTDVGAVAEARLEFGDSLSLMVDANQAWSARHALEVANAIAEHKPIWLEEPIRATEPPRVWAELATRSPIPLAAGENIRSESVFRETVTGGSVRHIQPDVGKWGGVSGCVTLGRWAVARGVSFSPHWAGGGIGFAHSLHVLAAVGGDGYAEIDITPNPLRHLLYNPAIVNGLISLGDGPGIGFTPDFESLASILDVTPHFARN